MKSRLVVMSSGSAEPALDAVALAFRHATGHTVDVHYNCDIPEADVILASDDALKRRFFPAGRIARDAVCVGSVGLGLASRAGVDLPPIKSTADLEQALLAADGIFLTKNHTSGLYMETVFRRRGLFDQVAWKIQRLQNAPAVLGRVRAGIGKEVLFLSINEIRTWKDKGIAFVAPLPNEVQYLRPFSVVSSASSAARDVAQTFVRFCGEEAKPIFFHHGFV